MLARVIINHAIVAADEGYTCMSGRVAGAGKGVGGTTAGQSTRALTAFSIKRDGEVPDEQELWVLVFACTIGQTNSSSGDGVVGLRVKQRLVVAFTFVAAINAHIFAIVATPLGGKRNVHVTTLVGRGCNGNDSAAFGRHDGTGDRVRILERFVDRVVDVCICDSSVVTTLEFGLDDDKASNGGSRRRALGGWGGSHGSCVEGCFVGGWGNGYVVGGFGTGGNGKCRCEWWGCNIQCWVGW